MKKLDPQPGSRAPIAVEGAEPLALGWDVVAPGLYPDETAFDLGDGLFVAVDVQAVWQANGDVALLGNARWIDRDGQTHLTPEGEHVETSLPANATPGFVDALGIPALQRHVALALLGEPSEAGGFVWPEAVLASVDIRRAVARVKQATAPDLGALLGVG